MPNVTVRKPRPNTAGRRSLSFEDFSKLSKKRPEKSLIKSLNRKAGRGHGGKISVRHRGGGQKRLYRLISDLSKKLDVSAKVLALEYDPNRSAFIALVEYTDKQKTYILAPQELKVGDEIIASEKTVLKPGNRMKLKNIPSGLEIYNLELFPGRGKGQIVKSAGSQAKVLAKEGDYASVQLPSGEVRKIHLECFASIGIVSNPSHSAIRIGKAGRQRRRGIRPTVRGKAMHPAAHPHGGGEGVNPIGLKYPKTPWGKHALGVKTRKKKYSNKFILKRRK